jgi:predicted AAA+ superfamily ATPase
MIRRTAHLADVSRLLKRSGVVALLGARQVGKTTLARALYAAHPGPKAYFDLEDAADLARLTEPSRALAPLQGLVVLDEVQRRPEIFPSLRVLADRPKGARFLVLGSASPHLLRQTSESLAGRITFHELQGLGLGEVGAGHAQALWLRGGFPRSYLAKTAADSLRWRRDFMRTFLERDVPQLGVSTAAATLRRFWQMLAHLHGQVMNWSELGRSMGVTDHTVRAYLDLLVGTFMVRQLQPWHENLSKRQVKAPKVYVLDSGLLHALLDVGTAEQLDGHPKVGASWEGFCLEQVVRHLRARGEQCYFWATHSGAELDLLVIAGGRRLGFEFKYTDAPSVTPSMRSALESLKLDTLDVVHAGSHTFPLGERIRGVALRRLLSDLKPLD